MAQTHMVRRSEKVKRLLALLAEKQIVYLSCFFFGGKTVLINQTAEKAGSTALRFSAGKEDWRAFEQRARRHPDALLLIDDLHQLPDENAESLSAFLDALPDSQRVLLAGRAKIPAALRSLMMSGKMAVLDKDFVLFDAEEAEQLFLDYGLQLLPQDIAYLTKECWGSPFAFHAIAQRMQATPERSARTVCAEVFEEIKRLMISDILIGFSEPERILLCQLSPFERFNEDMARIVTGRTDAPVLMQHISANSYALLQDGPDTYSFIPIVRQALFREMKNHYTQADIDSQYKRAALYYELAEQLPQAISYYLRLNDTQKIRELLIRDTHQRPSNGSYVELREAYARLSEDTILSSPELMKGMCVIESLQGHAEESERWYQEIRQFIKNTSSRDARRRTAEEAIAYLDIGLAQRGTKHILSTLFATAKLKNLTVSDSWRSGFNVAGNSVSLLNGGKDFCRWVPHGWNIYRVAKLPVEMALGRGGSGMGDIAIGECELESNISGDYSLALDKIQSGLARGTDDLEMRCAAIGIQSRILMAEGNLEEAVRLMDHILANLPSDVPVRLRENMQVHRLTLLLMRGDTREALAWLETEAPDETREFIILDRYKLMLKLRLYIVTAQWQRTRLLISQLKQYFDNYDRPYLRIQLHLLQAVICKRTGKEDWKEEVRAAVSLARHYRLARVIADEGIAVLDMLNSLDLPKEPWETGVLRLTRQQAAQYPSYMKPIGGRPTFTDREYEVYSLIAAGYKNAQIAAVLNITERTVKHYASVVYEKLGVSSRAEAITKAVELGDANR